MKNKHKYTVTLFYNKYRKRDISTSDMSSLNTLAHDTAKVKSLSRKCSDMVSMDQSSIFELATIL